MIIILLCLRTLDLILVKKHDKNLSKSLASIADIFVFDAFGVAHRKECSTYGLSDYLDTVAGLNILDMKYQQ